MVNRPGFPRDPFRGIRTNFMPIELVYALAVGIGAPLAAGGNIKPASTQTDDASSILIAEFGVQVIIRLLPELLA
jgi:hypothetical protein